MADANVSQLEINGTTYDICDATARDSLSQFQTTVQNTYLPLTGDTMTGKLTVNGAPVESIGSSMIAKDTVIDRDAATPSASQWGPGLLICDKDNEDIGRVRSIRSMDGYTYLRLSAHGEKTDGTAVENAFDIKIDRNGNQTYNVSNASNFRSAIGAQATLVASSGNATRTSAVESDGWCTFYRWGRVCRCNFWFKVKSPIDLWSSSPVLFTGLPANVWSNGNVCKKDDTTATYSADVDASGQFRISARETAAAVNGYFTGGFVYITT